MKMIDEEKEVMFFVFNLLDLNNGEGVCKMLVCFRK